MWTAHGIRPIVTMTGSHQRTCVFGTLCIDSRQFFRIQFRGSLESVYKSTINFIVKQLPDTNIAKKISLNYPVDYLVKKYSNLIKVIPDKGTRVLIQPDRLEEEEEGTATFEVEDLERHKNQEKLKGSKSVLVLLIRHY
jgi:hypothetical protein